VDSEKVPENCDEVRSAVAATADGDKGRQRILIKKSIEFGCVEHIPESWEVDISE
jgi:hypothetical protein